MKLVVLITQQVIIKKGNYSQPTLASALRDAFLLNNDDIQISFNTISGIINFTSTSNFTFINSTILNTLGFRFSSKNYTSANSIEKIFSLSGDFPFSIIGTRKLKVCSNQLLTTCYDLSV